MNEDERNAGAAGDGIGDGLADGLLGVLAAGARVGGVAQALMRRQGSIAEAKAKTYAALGHPSRSRWEKNARSIGESMKPDWWAKRERVPPAALADTLVQYAQEREERERKRAEKRKAARPSVEAIRASSAWLSAPVEEKILAAVERTALYYSRPGERPPALYPEPRPKDWDKLSESSRAVYLRSAIQTSKEMKERNIQTNYDMVAYLAEKAATRSKSVYNRHRAVLLQMAEKKGNSELSEIVKSMPHYGELCAILGREPSRRVGERTRARRRQKDERIWEKINDNLKDVYQDFAGVMRATGARIGEAPSLKIELSDDTNAVIATLRTSKTGCRREKAPVFRTIKFSVNSAEAEFLRDLMARRGAEPLSAVKASQFQFAWYRARQKADVPAEHMERWCPHALRHDYAHRRKAEIVEKLRSEHGREWRTKLYGVDWRDNPKYSDDVYGELAREMGHSTYEMTRQYG